MKNLMKATLSIAILAAAALPAVAGTITIGPATPTADAIQIPTANIFGPGPQSYVGTDAASTYTWTSTNATYQGGAVYGWTGGYGFLGNGEWDGALGPMVGVNDSFAEYGVTDTMTITFTGGPVYEAGDFFNYVPGGNTPTTLNVYGASGLLSTIDLNNTTFPSGTDVGLWVTMTESVPITYFTVQDNFVGFADPYDGTYIPPSGPSSTPEPNSLLLFGTGLVGFAGVIRRKFAKSL
jgi:hypothetical protein